MSSFGDRCFVVFVLSVPTETVWKVRGALPLIIPFIQKIHQSWSPTYALRHDFTNIYGQLFCSRFFKNNSRKYTFLGLGRDSASVAQLSEITKEPIKS